MSLSDQTIQELKNKSRKPEEKFDDLMFSDSNLQAVTSEHDRKHKQIQGRYEELKGKLSIKFADQIKTFQKLQSNINDISDLKTAIGLIMKEFDNARKEYAQNLAIL